MAAAFGTALVVGASSGIGEAMVRRLAREGTMVAAVARREVELQRIASECGGKARVYRHDVKDYGEAPALFDRIVADLGGLDLFVYCAGIMPRVDEGEYSFA